MTSLHSDKFGIFKTYDIRGIYPKEINESVIREIGAGLVKMFGGGTVIIGRDGRLSSPALYRAILREFKRNRKKIKIIAAGLITTPMLYFLVNKLKARGGVMVTASHNPKEYNGLKIVGEKAKMISGKEILKIMSNSPNF
jgi:phosphomannomutase